MTLVADASPLIFLAKVDCLNLISRLFKGPVRIPESVRDEVLAPPTPTAEEQVLRSFLDRSRIEPVANPRRFAAALSRADNDALTLAVRIRADLLLADDRLLRELARVEHIRPMGTLGILLRAQEQEIHRPADTQKLVDALIRRHGFRIGIEVYRATLERIHARQPKHKR